MVGPVIHYVVTAPHTYTLDPYLDEWAPEMASCIDVITYEELPGRAELPTGVYIFSDLERLSAGQTAAAVQAYKQLSVAGDRVKLLNHPGRGLRRHELLRKLHKTGLNRFAAYRLSETRTPRCFPVFLRYENEHDAALSPVLRNQDELDGWVIRAAVRGHDLRHLLIVEFCDTADSAGIYRKYSANVVGDAVIPRHLYFGEDWVVKHSPKNEVKKAWIREESQYLERNPHEGFVRDVFRLANLEYGRIDYSLLDGSPQVWEINTNPYLIHERDFYAMGAGSRLNFQDEFVRRMGSALRSLDSGMEGGGIVRVSVGSRAGPTRQAGERRSLRSRVRVEVLRRPKLQRFLMGLAERLEPTLLAMRGPILKGIDRRLRPR